MPNHKSQVGQRFGRLVVLEERRAVKGYEVYCRCDCGTEKWIPLQSLRCGTVSCGCARHYGLHKSIVGQRFGRLLVLDERYSGKTWEVYCRCDCGAEKWMRQKGVASGEVQSCGCLLRDKPATSYMGRCFGRLVVLEEERRDGKLYCFCRCDCGAEKWIPKHNIIDGARSCGCLSDETGRKNVRSFADQVAASGINAHLAAREAPNKNCGTGVRNVSFSGRDNAYLVQVRLHGEIKTKRGIATIEEAIKVRDQFRAELFDKYKALMPPDRQDAPQSADASKPKR